MTEQEWKEPVVTAEEPDTDATVEIDSFGTAVVPEWVRDAEPEDLTAAVEAACFSLNRALSVAELAGIVGCTPATAARAADSLAGQLRDSGRGLMLQRHGAELQLVTRPDVAWVAQRALNPERPGRLSKAALETLAIIAYRQPTTRIDVDRIRGVNCEAVLDSLERRGLIAEVGREEAPGHPRLFGTTLRFLQIVGLERIEDLPPLPEGVAMPALDEPQWAGVEISDEAVETPEAAGAASQTS